MSTEDRALQFARSLDEEDYDSARRCLSPGCEYSIAGQEYRGPDAIIGSYRENGDWASQVLDSLRFESSVRMTGARSAIVTFVDHLERKGRKLTHRCEQHLEFADDGLIERIRHVDLPGEPEAVDRFFAEVGIARRKTRDD